MLMGKQPQISDAEWEVMKALWQAAPVSVSELTQRLKRDWHPKTVRTMLLRLQKKGVVASKVKDGVYQYFATVTREECTRSAAHSFLDRVFDGALAPMVAHFVSGRGLTADEKRELKKLLASGSSEKKR